MLKNFINEFKTFAMKGNAIDMAVGVITGSILTGVVNSLVKDILMPPIGLLLGGVDFSEIFIILRGGAEGVHYHTVAAAQAAGATTLNIGLFVNAIISFVITMFAVFMFIKMINKMKAPAVAPTPTRSCPYCFVGGINLNATKCPSCCSPIKPVKAAAAPAPEHHGIADILPVKNITGKLKKVLKHK